MGSIQKIAILIAGILVATAGLVTIVMQGVIRIDLSIL
jgi:hypothetical protein